MAHHLDRHVFDFKAIIEECNRLRKELQSISNRSRGPLEASQVKNTRDPFALILGNHSSGKSTFVNYVLGAPVQSSGVAPTDDCFTIIAHGESDLNRNGSALIGDPDLGFHDLVQFGPMLVHKTQLKVRSGISLRNMMLIDSPGMIDAPIDDKSSSDINAVMDRGYDFQGAVRWFAERADVILVFFDPDKPGTTSETLSILTQAISGFDQKILLIFNKADKFRKVYDFARAYGSLCWNLAKIIPRKDLPQLYTMFVPRSYHNSDDKSDDKAVIRSPVVDHGSDLPDDEMECCLRDLEQTR
jgi:energy-coupling factor transporter ATP-binding protein EcfA2